MCNITKLVNSVILFRLFIVLCLFLPFILPLYVLQTPQYIAIYFDKWSVAFLNDVHIYKNRLVVARDSSEGWVKMDEGHPKYIYVYM